MTSGFSSITALTTWFTLKKCQDLSGHQCGNHGCARLRSPSRRKLPLRSVISRHLHAAFLPRPHCSWDALRQQLSTAGYRAGTACLIQDFSHGHEMRWGPCCLATTLRAALEPEASPTPSALLLSLLSQVSDPHPTLQKPPPIAAPSHLLLHRSFPHKSLAHWFPFWCLLLRGPELTHSVYGHVLFLAYLVHFPPNYRKVIPT